MFSLKLRLTTITLSILASCARAQFVSNLPDCVQDCINSSQDENCDDSDIQCLCRASAGNFLTDTVICIHNNCDNDLDNDLLLGPIEFVCDVAGTPIPESALKNAENEASSLATQDTVTVTMTPSAAPAYSILSTVTVTTTVEGMTFSEVYPITIGSTTTASGSPFTIPASSSTKSTHSSSIPSSHSTITSSTTFTSTVLADATSSSKLSSITASKTSTAASGKGTDSAPFTNTNGSGKTQVGKWLGMSVLLAAGYTWL